MKVATWRSLTAMPSGMSKDATLDGAIEFFNVTGLSTSTYYKSASHNSDWWLAQFDRNAYPEIYNDI